MAYTIDDALATVRRHGPVSRDAVKATRARAYVGEAGDVVTVDDRDGFTVMVAAARLALGTSDVEYVGTTGAPNWHGRFRRA